jgi:hypothetical protein
MGGILFKVTGLHPDDNRGFMRFYIQAYGGSYNRVLNQKGDLSVALCFSLANS